MSELIVNQIHKSLLKSNQTIAVAESCTGGLLSTLLTDLPGSSKYLILGVVAYNNKVKESILKVPHSILLKNGAVCREVARKMAQSVKKIAKTDFAIGITGLAGPSGGSPQKPVGTVFIAVTDKNKTICKKFLFTGNRSTIRKKSALKALEMLYESFYRH